MTWNNVTHQDLQKVAKPLDELIKLWDGTVSDLNEAAAVSEMELEQAYNNLRNKIALHKYDLYINGKKHNHVPMTVKALLNHLNVFLCSGEINPDALPLSVEIREPGGYRNSSVQSVQLR